jgi:hypothetical protein
MTPTKNEQQPRMRWAEIVAILAFLAGNVIVPLVWGDVFPFTTAPMFRDTPQAYCIYRVFTTEGVELPAADFLLQRIYDGNPPGYGVGIQPPATLADFGRVASEAEIVSHVEQQLSAKEIAAVEIEQEVIGPKDNGSVGVVMTRKVRVERRVTSL